MAQASSIQPGLGNPTAGQEEQPSSATQPPCGEEAVSCLEAGSMQQHPQDLQIQLRAPTPAPEVPEVHATVMETSLHNNKGQETLDCLITESKQEQELGLPHVVDKTQRNVAASAPPTPQRPEKCDVVVVPMVQDLPLLDEAVKRELECHIAKMKMQKRYGLQKRVLDCEQSFEQFIFR